MYTMTSFGSGYITNVPDELLKTYHYITHKAFLPPVISKQAENIAANTPLVASLVANFASLGYRLDTDITNVLLASTKANIIKFYQTYMPIVQEEIGTRFKDANVFYPGFPEQVPDLDRAQIMLDQFIYGLSGFEVQPGIEHSNEKPDYKIKREQIQEEMPFLRSQNANQLHLIQSADKDDLSKTFNECLLSLKPFTNAQRLFIEQIAQMLHQQNISIQSCLNQPLDMILPCRENKAIFAAITAHTEPEVAKAVLKDPKDILRTASVMNCMRGEHTAQTLAQAATLQKGVRFNVSRADRRFLLNALEEQAKGRFDGNKLAGEMWAQKELWKKFFKDTHQREYSKQFPIINKAHTIVANNITPQRFSSMLEKAIADKDLDKALSLAETRPGELFRRADKLLRIAEEQGQAQVTKVISTLENQAQKAGISTVVSLSNVLGKRTQDENSRYVSYMYDGINKTVNLSDSKLRKAFKAETLEKLNEFKDKTLSPQGLAPRFAGKDLGKMYISPEMQYYTVPMSTRELSEGIETFGHGSAIDAKSDHDVKRLFVQWTNIARPNAHDERIDIDLSARIIYPDRATHVSWNSNYAHKIKGQTAIVYSGDIQNGGPSNGPGAAEYIDINVPLLKEEGAKYIIASVNSYCMQGYDKQPNTYFGWMDRDVDDMGKKFEPQTVQQRFKLTSKATMENAIVYDLAHDRIVWIDEPIKGRVMTDRTKEADMIIQDTLEKVFTIENLARANAIANEGETNDIDEADIALMTKQEYEQLSEEQREKLKEKQVKIIFPSNILALTALLLANKVLDKQQTQQMQVNIQGHDKIETHHERHREDRDEIMH